MVACCVVCVEISDKGVACGVVCVEISDKGVACDVSELRFQMR